jgi:hypothetical protein
MKLPITLKRPKRDAMNQSNLLCTFASYQGDFTPANLVFNANLQEFSQRVSLIVALETGGKLSALDAYEQIESLRKVLDKSKKQLGITNN